MIQSKNIAWILTACLGFAGFIFTSYDYSFLGGLSIGLAIGSGYVTFKYK